MINRSKNRIAIVIPYYGAFKPWFPFFCESVRQANQIDFILITDNSLEEFKDIENLIHYHICLKNLKDKIDLKLGININLSKPYKLVDLKAAYGFIFEELLVDYSYWGFGDEDLVFGNINKFIRPLINEDYDIISALPQHLCGHFTLLKNREKINTLFLKGDLFHEMIKDEETWGYDEISWFKYPQGAERESFTTIVKNQIDLKIHWGLPIREGLMFRSEKFIWDNGILKDDKDVEYAYYHWNYLKKGVFFKFPNWSTLPKKFNFDFWGFHHDLTFKKWFKITRYFPKSIERAIYFAKTKKYY